MLRLCTLGALDVLGADGREVHAVLAQRKRFALLAYLALARPRGFQQRDRLLALFWPEQDEEHARNALNQAVHFLRRALGTDAIVARNGDDIGVDRSVVWCDAVAFEDALDSGKRDEALEIYRGDLLEGFHVSDVSPELDRWIESERSRLSDRHLRALTAAAEEREAAGDFPGAVAWWRRAAAHDRFSSRLALRLMQALAAAGDPAGAIQFARLHEALLRAELDVAPDGDVAAFVATLQAAAPLRAEPQAEPHVEPPTPIERVARRPDPPGVGRRDPRRRLLPAAAASALVAGALGVAAFGRAHESAAPVIHSLAVLPLVNMSGDPTQDFLADGMTDALITELAHYPEIRVISRTSSARYGRGGKPLPDIARELHVDGIVEGSLVRDGSRVRVTAQLIHAPSDRHLWAHRYERDVRDVLALQDELADAIAREVHVVSTPALQPRRPARPVDAVAHGLYVRGHYAMLTRTPAALRQAIAFLREAIARDSAFAPAWAELAAVYGIASDDAFLPAGPANDSSRVLAEHALALDSTLSQAHTVLAGTYAEVARFDDAEREFRRAIELEPGNALAHHWYAMLLATTGRMREARDEIARARDLDPLSPAVRSTAGAIAGQLRASRPAWTRALTKLWTARRPKVPQAADVDPTDGFSRAGSAVAHARAGRCAEARTDIARAQELVPDNLRMLVMATGVRWACGDSVGARAELADLERRPDAGAEGIWLAALHVTMLRQPDSAFVWLGRTQWNVLKRFNLRTSVWLAPLRSDPRYAEVLARAGLH